MGDRKIPKRYKNIRLYDWQYQSLDEIMLKEGLDTLMNTITFLIRLYNIYDAYRERVGVRDLQEFAKILDEFLPVDPRYRIFRAFNQFQEELVKAGVPKDIVGELSEHIVNVLERVARVKR